MNLLKDNQFLFSSQLSDSSNAFSHSQVCLQPKQPPLYPYFKRPEREPNCSTHVTLELRTCGAERTLPVTIFLPVVHRGKAYLNYNFRFFRDVTFLPQYMTSHCSRRYNSIHFAIPSSICVLHNRSIKAQLIFGYFASMRHPASDRHRKGVSPPPSDEVGKACNLCLASRLILRGYLPSILLCD